jgi:3-oxoacyl-[acyl-carrier protein] reductase
MDLGIKGRVAFVSGGSMGMGRSAAELFAQEGCRVVIVALPRDQDSIDETVAAITAAGGEAVGVGADLTVRAEVERAVGTAASTFGSPPDIAVANVDGPGTGNFDDVSDDDFRVAMDRMMMSMVYLCRAVLPHMREQRWGRIVNLNSMGAKEPPPGLAHVLVNPSRAAVANLDKTLANEFAQFGITINTIGTGFIGTGRMHAYVDRMAAEQGVPREDVLAAVSADAPAGRIGTPEEMAGVVAFLCSEYAGYVNGEFIHVDGGTHRSAM